jgi:hypothetical protein
LNTRNALSLAPQNPSNAKPKPYALLDVCALLRSFCRTCVATRTRIRAPD